MKTLYPCLHVLFSGYFHQDWEKASPASDDIILRYLAESSSTSIALVLGELTILLSHARPEKSLHSALMSLGCFYNPGIDGLTFTQWLRGLHLTLQAGRA